MKNSSVIDIADAIFGYVGKEEKRKDKKESCAGRVFISDATTSDKDVWLQSIKPKILGSPKVTTYQHYLVQPDDTGARKENLKHYASNSGQDTVIRGHKLYWHQKNISLDRVRERDLEKLRKGKKQLTEIRPIRAGTKFIFDIHFENLSQIELGALLWVLSLSSNRSESLGIGKTNEQYCFSLGMGKPLGMGAVKIDYDLCLSDRPERYRHLFSETGWHVAERSDTDKDIETCVKAFESFMLNPETGIHNDDHPEGNSATRLVEVPRIEMLLAMLRCDETPTDHQTRYMTIENKKYLERPVLPTPLQVMGIPDRRRSSFQEVSKKSNSVNQKQPVVKAPSRSETYQIGQILDAEIVKKNGVQITYKIQTTGQRLTEKEHKKADSLNEGQVVKVKIIALKEDGSIKHVKLFEV